MEILRDFRKSCSPVGSTLQLAHFPIYSSRLQHIQKQMNTWRPQRLSQLMVRGYRDPLTFYLFWFSIIVGIVSVVGLGATLAQTYATFKSI